MNPAIAYVESAACRSRQLLQYFGESDAAACGQCDYCLSLKKKPLSASAFGRFAAVFDRRLLKGPCKLEELVADFDSDEQELALQALSFLLDEGYYIQKGNAISKKQQHS